MGSTTEWRHTWLSHICQGTFSPGDARNGFVNDYRAFGSGIYFTSILFPDYNGGKTAVHEIGHYFNLDHHLGSIIIQPSNPTCTLTDNCADTPPTDGPTFGCPSAPVLNACSPSAPGVMWQNHMDYADDRLYDSFYPKPGNKDE